jgi:hypothetical protein|tara:strand:- start:49 stop:219 length:171 start_codon:yes stop_codon:yes gene_type:complete
MKFSAEHWRYYAAQLAKICEHQTTQIKEQKAIILKLIKKRILQEGISENKENENIH